MTFSVDGFDAVSLSPRNSARNFPLQVESYDTTGEVHYVTGYDFPAHDGCNCGVEPAW